MAAGLSQVQTGLSAAEQFLDEPEAISADDRLAQNFPAGIAEPTVVVTADDADRVAAAVAEVPTATPGQTTRIDGDWSKMAVALDARAGRGRRGGGARPACRARRVRGASVGGAEAEAIDDADAAARNRGGDLPRGARSVVVGVPARCASRPSTWGWPWLTFLYLVALGVDYNIFLVTRAAEEAKESGTREGMLRALAATGGVITSAGILLAAVFTVLGVLPLVVLAQLGVVIGIGVLLDTLLVRTVLVPAIAVRLGDRFWWPRRFGADVVAGTTDAEAKPQRGNAAMTPFYRALRACPRSPLCPSRRARCRRSVAAPGPWWPGGFGVAPAGYRVRCPSALRQRVPRPRRR